MFLSIDIFLDIKLGIKMFTYLYLHRHFLLLSLLQVKADLTSNVFDAKIFLKCLMKSILSYPFIWSLSLCNSMIFHHLLYVFISSQRIRKSSYLLHLLVNLLSSIFETFFISHQVKNVFPVIYRFKISWFLLVHQSHPALYAYLVSIVYLIDFFDVFLLVISDDIEYGVADRAAKYEAPRIFY